MVPLGRLIDSFASMTADLALLLATLSIMTGALVITGVPTKIGAIWSRRRASISLPW